MILFFNITQINSNRGVIFDGKELHYVEPQSGSSLDDEHILMKHSDLTANFSCGKLG